MNAENKKKIHKFIQNGMYILLDEDSSVKTSDVAEQITERTKDME